MDKYSFLNAVHAQLIDDMYERYLQYPDSLEPSWKAFFQGFDFALDSYGDGDTSVVSEIVSQSPKSIESLPEDITKEFKVIDLINAYKTRGHLFSQINPLSEREKSNPDLDIFNFGLSSSDLNLKFNAASYAGFSSSATLSEIINQLQKIYSTSIGVEYMYILNKEERDFIQNHLQVEMPRYQLSSEQKIRVLTKLNQATQFETYLNTKFVGQKRFSLEGGESLIPAFDYLMDYASNHQVNEVVLGMPHRGRLSVLTNIFQKPYRQIFSEFEGKEFEEHVFSGDVKYHLGASKKIETSAGKEMMINLVPNPSHLETVASLVEGISRAKIDLVYNQNAKEVLPIVLHGDAALSGQGIVYEVAQMMSLEGYRTGGTIHIVVNNQVGFTTDYKDSRSSIYCTGIAKVTDSPVFHVNADDVEMVIYVMKLACDYRQAFGKDVYLDLVGYRKYGHNEGDEPRFTQPKMYGLISKHKNVRDLYKEKLIGEGVLSQETFKSIETEFKNVLDTQFEESRLIEKNKMDIFMEPLWSEFQGDKNVWKEIDTRFEINELKNLAIQISTLPKDKKFIKKITRLFEQRLKMIDEDKLDWALGELLAYATLLKEGYNIRISGEDVQRGTFSHRHAVLKTEDTEEKYIPLSLVNENQKFDIYNSLLSEYAVLGFDYGYAVAAPSTLTVWEAQFGDFVNGGQIIIDQYLVAAEEKWDMQNGLVMMLPNGSEGQGAEHSSGRVERFLTLCANNNIFVANCTTPANYFHLLRRQMKFAFRKPLVVMTPKSLLRHPKVVSSLEELSSGSFQTIIDDASAQVEKIERVVLCTGKVYYDLLAKKEELNDEKVALVRIEQLYPFDKERLKSILDRYQNKKEVVWVQEEPENMGAWSYILRNFVDLDIHIKLISHPASGVPAPGSHKKFEINQQEIITKAFKLN